MLRLFENWVVENIFLPKRDEVTGEWRKLHNEELHDLYCSPNIFRVIKFRRMRWARHVARMGEGRGVYRVLVGKPEGERPLRIVSSNTPLKGSGGFRHNLDIHTDYLCVVWQCCRLRRTLFLPLFMTLNTKFSQILSSSRGPGSGIATGYGLNGQEIESRWERDFSHTSRPASYKWVPGLSRG
jgi:hypothetical protein